MVILEFQSQTHEMGDEKRATLTALREFMMVKIPDSLCNPLSELCMPCFKACLAACVAVDKVF